jgi:hypothetical protein
MAPSFALAVLRLFFAATMASFCSSWRWILITAVGALPFVIVMVSRVMLVLVTAAVHAVVMARSVPSLGSTISAGFPPWRIIFVSGITASPALAIIVAYDNSSLWDLERLILWWRHVGLMARGTIVLLVSVSRVILAGWQWISLRAFAMWFVIGGYWDGVHPITSFSSLDF